MPSNELIRRSPQGPDTFASRGNRRHNAEVATIIQKARLDGVQLDADAALAARAMERLVDLDSHRRILADGDPLLDQLLGRIETTYLDNATGVQRGSLGRLLW